MRILAATALTLALTGQAAALSCARPDIKTSFGWWAESEDTFYIGVGTLQPLEPLLKVKRKAFADGSNSLPQSAEYRFKGEFIGPDFDVPTERPVTVTVSCLASWCGAFPKGKLPQLMAMKVGTYDELSISVGPCPGTFFPAETAATVKECMRAGSCP